MWGVDMVRSMRSPGGIWPGLYAFGWPSPGGPRGMKLPSGKYPMFCSNKKTIFRIDCGITERVNDLRVCNPANAHR